VCYIHAKHAQADRGWEATALSARTHHTNNNQFSRATQFAFFPYSAAATVKFSQDGIAAEAEKMHIFHRQERLDWVTKTVGVRILFSFDTHFGITKYYEIILPLPE
jgi:hypothetical protein